MSFWDDYLCVPKGEGECGAEKLKAKGKWTKDRNQESTLGESNPNNETQSPALECKLKKIPERIEVKWMYWKGKEIGHYIRSGLLGPILHKLQFNHNTNDKKLDEDKSINSSRKQKSLNENKKEKKT